MDSGNGSRPNSRDCHGGRISRRRGARHLHDRRAVDPGPHAGRRRSAGRRHGGPRLGGIGRARFRRRERRTPCLRNRRRIAVAAAAKRLSNQGSTLRMNIFARLTIAAALAATALGGSAASATEITFYYPIAVGGPITKIVDGYAAEFSKAHPDITVKPVYTGSYQDLVVKAMTAAKAGNAPDVASCCRPTCSPDRRRFDRALRRARQIGERPDLDQILLSGVHGKQSGRRSYLGHSVPALDDRAVLEQGCLQGRRPRPGKAPAHLG